MKTTSQRRLRGVVHGKCGWLRTRMQCPMSGTIFHQRSNDAHGMAMAPARHDAFQMLRNNTIPFKHLRNTMAGKTVQP